MTRRKMASAISEVVNLLQYTLYTGTEYRINDSVKVFPAAWLTPAKLTGIEGRERGIVVYAVTIHLMLSGRQLTQDQKLSAWSKMEQDAIVIYRELAMHESVTSVDGLKCTPAEFSLSNHGEISMTVDFNIEMHFCA